MTSAIEASPYRKSAPSKRVVKALDRLREHVSDPERVHHDRIAVGKRVRPRAYFALMLSALGVFVVVTAIGTREARPIIMGAALAGFGGLLAYLSLRSDLALPPRDRPSSPEATLEAFFKAVAKGRYGYAWSTLSPRARDQEVKAPDLGRVDDASLEDLVAFPLATPEGVAAYATTFAHPGFGKMRRLSVERVTLRTLDGDIAHVDVELAFQSLSVNRPAFGNILLLLKSPKLKVRRTKTLLRVDGGGWYLFDGNVLEG